MHALQVLMNSNMFHWFQGPLCDSGLYEGISGNSPSTCCSVSRAVSVTDASPRSGEQWLRRTVCQVSCELESFLIRICWT